VTGTEGEGSGVMRVRTELVLEQLVSRILGRALELEPESIPADAARVLESGPEPHRLARLGYASRIAETELFQPARTPMPELNKMLDQRTAAGEDRAEAVVSMCAELAADEPDEKPDPGQGSWRVPGPGGHVRHFLSLAAADELTHGSSNGEPPVSRELSSGEAKRCFL
jgi:hypothetical protein